MAGEPRSERVSLRAGPWRLTLIAGELRHICWGQCEVVRRIYVAVRDRFWNTTPAVLSDLRVVQDGESGFEITFLARHLDAEVDFAWRGVITGDPSGAITYRMSGSAQAGFWRNRIGICVLHPITCAGQPCRITHADSSIEESFFPDEIAPHQPFLDVQAIAHPVAPDAWAEVRFAGEVFETEDQRNWSDGSFKTYSTPLRLPRPTWVEAGTLIEQSATLTASGTVLETGPARSDETCIILGHEAPAPLPRLGLALAADEPEPGPSVSERLRGLRLAHLRADLALDRPGWEAGLRRAATMTRLLGAPLELALTLSADAPAELARLAALREELPQVWAWLVFDRGSHVTPPALVQNARPVLQRITPGALVGGGSDIYFAQLNRSRPPAGVFDVLSYPITPQVHAGDDDTLIESLAGEAATVRTARRFANGAAIAVSPITLKPRANPNAPATGAAAAPPPADPRQESLFAAGWTAISFKYLAESGADSVTCFETSGSRGVMPAEDAAPAVYPVYHVLMAIGEFAGGGVIRCVSKRPLQADALHLTAGRRHRLLIASFADTPQTVTIAGQELPRGSEARVRFLDELNAGRALYEPERPPRGEGVQAMAGELRLRMPPFAVAQVDW